MKKILVAYGVLVVIVVILAFAKFNGTNLIPNFGANKATVTINNTKYSVEVANDDKARQIGLSERKSLDQNKGMLFIFPKKDKYGFWMKNTLVPLDMIFINDDKIVHIVKNAKPEKEVEGALPIYRTPNDANYVLEVNAGETDKNKFKNGDKVILEAIK